MLDITTGRFSDTDKTHALWLRTIEGSPFWPSSPRLAMMAEEVQVGLRRNRPPQPVFRRLFLGAKLVGRVPCSDSRTMLYVPGPPPGRDG